MSTKHNANIFTSTVNRVRAQNY